MPKPRMVRSLVAATLALAAAVGAVVGSRIGGDDKAADSPAESVSSTGAPKTGSQPVTVTTAEGERVTVAPKTAAAPATEAPTTAPATSATATTDPTTKGTVADTTTSTLAPGEWPQNAALEAKYYYKGDDQYHFEIQLQAPPKLDEETKARLSEKLAGAFIEANSNTGRTKDRPEYTLGDVALKYDPESGKLSVGVVVVPNDSTPYRKFSDQLKLTLAEVVKNINGEFGVQLGFREGVEFVRNAQRIEDYFVTNQASAAAPGSSVTSIEGNRQATAITLG